MNVWVDAENPPQALVLRPIVAALAELGHDIWVTARDDDYTSRLLSMKGVPHQVVGRRSGAGTARKVIRLTERTVALAALARRRSLHVAVCHGARAVIAPARLLGIPLVALLDYEHVFAYPFRWANRVLVPEVLGPNDLRRTGLDSSRIVRYPGLKEELYVYDLRPDPAALDAAGIDRSRIVAVMRPPATDAHYHDSRSDDLFRCALEHLSADPAVQIVVVPRSARQAARLAASYRKNNVLVLLEPLDGPNLLWHADLVVGAGGTMNREAACLGVPVYSVFCGPLGGVDRALAQSSRLVLVRSRADVPHILPQRRRIPDRVPPARQPELLQSVTRSVLMSARGGA